MRYLVEVKQLVAPESLTDSNDRLHNPTGRHVIHANTAQAALIVFHQTVQIAALDDFEVIIKHYPEAADALGAAVRVGLEIPPDPDGMNTKRAGRAEDAIVAYLGNTGSSSDKNAAISDLLCDLRHMCDYHGEVFTTVLATSTHHYLAEITPVANDMPVLPIDIG